MLKTIEQLTDEEKRELALNSSGVCYYLATGDKRKYELFKEGKVNNFTENDFINMHILNILERLGFSLEEIGTYLYKELISGVVEELKTYNSNGRDMNKYRELLAKLNDGFSSIYHMIAREDLEIGLRSFHLYIEMALEEIDPSKTDLNLSYEIFGENVGEQSYGTIAFQIANYLVGFKRQNNVVPPKIRKLVNTPNVIRKEERKR